MFCSDETFQLDEMEVEQFPFGKRYIAKIAHIH